MQKVNFHIFSCKFCVCLLIVCLVIDFVQDSLIMFRRNYLPDSLRRKEVRWKEMGLSQADAARCLIVSSSVVQSLWNQFQTTDSVSRRPDPDRPRVKIPTEVRYLALSSTENKSHLHIKSVSSNKILIYCLPSFFKSNRIFTNDKCSVFYQSMHVGHQTVIDYLLLTESEWK